MASVTDSTLSGIFGAHPNPVYVMAPPLQAESAGVRLLYQLAHMINCQGGQAWIVPDGTAPSGVQHSLLYTAPVLTPRVARVHFQSGRVPIVVYSESVKGNPLGAPVVARWLLNSPGLLGGDRRFHASEQLFAYTSSLSAAWPGSQRLFLPTTDVREMERVPSLPWERRGTSAPILVYAAKYARFVGNPLVATSLSQGRPIVYIQRSGPQRQGRSELLRLLAGAHLLLAFENTATITEAVLLGTPVLLVRSPFFPFLLAEPELGSAGIAWFEGPDALGGAVSSLGEAKASYLSALANAPSDVEAFLRRMMGVAAKVEYQQITRTQGNLAQAQNAFRDRLIFARSIVATGGIRELVATGFESVARRLRP